MTSPEERRGPSIGWMDEENDMTDPNPAPKQDDTSDDQNKGDQSAMIDAQKDAAEEREEEGGYQ